MQAFLTDYQLVELASRLANTAPEVWHGTEQLADPVDLTAFLTQHDVTAYPGDGRIDEVDLEAVHRLRERLREALCSEDEPTAVRRASTVLASTDARPTLGQDTEGRWQWLVAVEDDRPLAERLALGTGVGLLAAIGSLGFDRFRSCAAPTCRGAFVDLSRPGRRRYCMPELCGNRVNVANHRARSRRT